MGKCIVVVLPEKKGKLTRQEFIDMFFSDNHYVHDVDKENLVKAFENMMKKYFFDIEKTYVCTYLLKKYVNKFIKKIRQIARSNC